MSTSWIHDLLGGKNADALLEHRCQTVPRDLIHVPGPDFIDRIFVPSDRNARVLANLQRLHNTGRLGGSGYLSILPVDQGIEHSAGASFAPNPAYFDPENIVKLAVEGGCNGVASTFGVLGSRRPQVRPQDSRSSSRSITTSCSPTPTSTTRSSFGTVRARRGTWARPPSARRSISARPRGDRQIVEVAQAFAHAHELGMATILWCYLRNPAFKTPEKDYHVAADLTGQANHLGVTIQADIIKQKLPENNGGFTALKFGKTSRCVYEKLTSRPPDRPVPLPGAQLLHGPHRPDQLRRRVARRRRPRRGRHARPSSTSAPAAWA